MRKEIKLMSEYWDQQDTAKNLVHLLGDMALKQLYMLVLECLLDNEEKFLVYSQKLYKTNAQREFIDAYYILKRIKTIVEQELLSRK
jgi:hypothetical protein